MDADKLVKRLAMQVAEYNLTNIQLQLKVEELEKENGELGQKLWDALPADTAEDQDKRKKKKQKEHEVVNADCMIQTRTLDGESQEIPGKRVRECSCGWATEGTKDSVEKDAAAHLFKVGAKG